MGQIEKWTREQVGVVMRMYPEEPHKRRDIAQRVAVEYPAIVQDIGAKEAQILGNWITAQGVKVETTTKNPDSWAEVFRLFFRYWKKTKRENFTPLELVRVLVWSAMGFKP